MRIFRKKLKTFWSKRFFTNLFIVYFVHNAAPFYYWQRPPIFKKLRPDFALSALSVRAFSLQVAADHETVDQSPYNPRTQLRRRRHLRWTDDHSKFAITSLLFITRRVLPSRAYKSLIYMNQSKAYLNLQVFEWVLLIYWHFRTVLSGYEQLIIPANLFS